LGGGIFNGNDFGGGSTIALESFLIAGRHDGMRGMRPVSPMNPALVYECGLAILQRF
jgi:hypothetical protein